MAHTLPRPFFTEEVGSGLRIAQVVGLTSAAFLCGKTFSLSFGATPALLQSPAPLLAKQWKSVTDRDRLVVTVLAALGGGITGYLAYKQPGGSTSQTLYATSAALLLTCLPYSFVTVEPLSQKLNEKADSLASTSLEEAAAEKGLAKEETVHGLVDKWATFNLGRTVLSGVAAALAIWASVDRLELVEMGLGLKTGADRMR